MFLAAGLLVTSAFTTWANSTLVDQEGFAKLANGLLSSDEIRSQLDTSVTGELEGEPPTLQRHESLIQQATSEVVADEQFLAILEEALVDMHRQLVEEEGPVYLDLSGMHGLIVVRMQSLGAGSKAVDMIPPADQLAQIFVLEERDADLARSAIGAFRSLNVIVIMLAIALIGGGLGLAPDRFRAIRTFGFQVAVIAGLAFLAITLMRTLAENVGQDPETLPATGSVWAVLAAPLQSRLLLLAVLGAAAAVAGYFAAKIRDSATMTP